jgi:hypothetical protein
MVTRLSTLLDDGQISGQFSHKAGYTDLNLTFRGGVFVKRATVTVIPETSVLLTASTTNFVYIDTNTLTVVTATVRPTEDFVLIASVVTGISTITTIVDERYRSLGLLDIT